MISQDLKKQLILLAKEAQEKAYVPYSKFAVGAALITEEGDIFTGCNIENISYGLSICGERTAIFKMISEKGPRTKIKAIVNTTKADIVCSPCGACRQVIQEFSTPDTVVIYKDEEDYVTLSINQILPRAFTEFIATEEDGSENPIRIHTS
jgi:cytidine deaminase